MDNEIRLLKPEAQCREDRIMKKYVKKCSKEPPRSLNHPHILKMHEVYFEQASDSGQVASGGPTRWTKETYYDLRMDDKKPFEGSHVVSEGHKVENR